MKLDNFPTRMSVLLGTDHRLSRNIDLVNLASACTKPEALALLARIRRWLEGKCGNLNTLTMREREACLARPQVEYPCDEASCAYIFAANGEKSGVVSSANFPRAS